MDKTITLNEIRMRVVRTAEIGVVNAETLFTFKQSGSIVSAEYAGGKVQMGYLIGVISSDILRFRYVQLDKEGRLDGGTSNCEISRTESGRIRLVEHFEWESREGAGINIFEQVLPAEI